MKMTKILLALLFSIPLGLSAQWNTVWTNPTNDFQGGCYATSADTCYVATYGGRIFRTTDGGTSWDSVQTLFTTSWFNQIRFSSPNVGYACGGTAFGTHSSIIAKTSNAGATWDSVTSNTYGYDFTKISLLNDYVGYFAGEKLVKTTDGGNTFTEIAHPFSAQNILALHFTDLNTGFMALRQYISSIKNRYKIARTTDGGTNWSVVYADSSTSASSFSQKGINDMLFINPLKGFAVCNNGNLLVTNNGGDTWSEMNLVADSTHLVSISMKSNSLVGYIAGWKCGGSISGCRGSIFKTTDGGLTWQRNYTYTTDALYSISMADDDNVYSTSIHALLKTTNGGVVGMPYINRSGNSVKIYPNPVSDKIIVCSPFAITENSTISIVDNKGALKTTYSVTDSCTEISTQQLPAGIYQLIISDGLNRQSVQKISIR